MSEVYTVVSRTTGNIIRLMELIGSTYPFVLFENGKEIKRFSHIGDAYRLYNSYAK